MVAMVATVAMAAMVARTGEDTHLRAALWPNYPPNMAAVCAPMA